MADESYALRRMRILFWAMATFCPVLGVKSRLVFCAQRGRPPGYGARPLKVVSEDCCRPVRPNAKLGRMIGVGRRGCPRLTTDLLDDLGDHAGADGAATLADG